MKAKFIVAAFAAALAAVPAQAHHSYAMFDKSKEIELANVTVKDWQWTSPHTWLFVVAPNGERYSLEGGNPGLMRRLVLPRVPYSLATGSRSTSRRCAAGSKEGQSTRCVWPKASFWVSV